MNRFQQKRVARLSFILFAAIPTCFVVAWIIIGPAKREWEADLSQNFPWKVRLGDAAIESRKTGVFYDVDFEDPELGSCGQLNQLEVNSSTDLLTILGDHLQVTPESIAPLLQDLIQHQVRRGRIEFKTIRVRIQRITLLSADRLASHHDLTGKPSRSLESLESSQPASSSLAQTWENFELTLSVRDDGFEAMLSFLPAGNRDSQRVELRVDYQTGTGETGPVWQLSARTEHTAIPCSLIANWFPQLKSIGVDATFQGQIQGRHTVPDGWDFQLAGTFTKLDFYSMSRAYSDQHAAFGKVQLELRDMEVVAGKIRHLGGTLTSDAGQWSPSILLNGVRDLGWSTRLPSELSQPLSYQKLFIDFDLTADELRVQGNPQNGVIAYSSRNEPIASAFFQTQRSPYELIRFLSGDSFEQVPLSKNTIGVASILELPATRPLGTSETGTSRIGLEE